jgi:plastocyanin
MVPPTAAGRLVTAFVTKGREKNTQGRGKTVSVVSDQLQGKERRVFISYFLLWGALLVTACASSSWAADLAGRVVGKNDEGVAQAVVFVDDLPDGGGIQSDQRFAVMDQVHKQFVPAVLPITVGSEVRFPNNDQIHHHVYSFSRSKSFELPLYKGDAAPPVLFDKLGMVQIGCNIHDWMSAVILVLPTSYFAITDEDGHFILRGLPPGTYTLFSWHEGSKTAVNDTAQEVEVSEDTPPLIFTLSLKPARIRPPVYGQRGYQ